MALELVQGKIPECKKQVTKFRLIGEVMVHGTRLLTDKLRELETSEPPSPSGDIEAVREALEALDDLRTQAGASMAESLGASKILAETVEDLSKVITKCTEKTKRSAAILESNETPKEDLQASPSHED